MTFGKKQYLVIFVVLLAVIGIVGAGCLGSNNDNNTSTNGTNNSTGNNSNTSNTSNNSSNTSNNTSSNNTSNNSSDVIYANQSSGGGGSSRGSTTAGSPATLNGAAVAYDEVKDGDVVNWYFYVANSTLTDEVMTLKMPATITDFVVNTAGLIAENGSGDTNSNYSGSTANILFSSSSTTAWETSDLTITAGGKTYEISFYASAVWKASATSGGSLSLVEIAEGGDTRTYNPANVSAGKSNVSFVSEPLRINFTLQPNAGYVGLLEVKDAGDASVSLKQTGLNTYETVSPVTSQAYTVNASFEKAAAGAYANGTAIKIEQNLNSQTNGKTIYLYVPTTEINGTTLTVKMPASITSFNGVETDIFDGDITISGSNLSLPMDNDLSSMQKAGAATPNPSSSITVETGTGPYNVSVLQSAVVQIVVPSGCTATSTGGLSLTQGTHNFVADVDLTTLSPLLRDTHSRSQNPVCLILRLSTASHLKVQHMS